MEVQASDIEPSFYISEEDVRNFKEKGYLKLKGLFSRGFIGYLSNNVDALSAKPVDRYGSDFSRFKYDVMNDDDRVLSILKDPAFSYALNKLTGRQLIYTQGISFELEKNASKGFPWHVGTQSFGFQRQSDFGLTIWTPLIPICPKKTGGGMAYVPKNVLSGEFIYQHINGIPDYVEKNGVGLDEEARFNFFSEAKNSILNSGYLLDFIEHFAEEDGFDLGDAFIFDKFVMHRSSPLFGGEHDVRSAFVFRFTDSEARYDRARVENLSFARMNFKYSGSSAFNDQIGVGDGELIRHSPLLGDVESRTVGNIGGEIDKSLHELAPELEMED